jgi:hypothetical protein
MKPAHLSASLVLVLTAAMLGHAQTLPYTATVKEPEAEVRSGPSNDAAMYVTNRLHRGELVQVVKVRDDKWLEIKPPPGSFSWVSMRFVDRIGNGSAYEVITHNEADAPVRIGSNVVNEKPTVEGVKLKRGSQVVSVGQPMTSTDEGRWLPIEPPPTEVRFIRAEAVQAVNVNEPPPAGPVPPTPAPAAPATGTVSGSGAAATDGAPAPLPPNMGQSVGGSGGSGSSATTTTSNSGPSSNPPAAAAPAPAPGTPEAMWNDAQQAEQAGRRSEAEQLYKELAHKVCNTNHDLAMRCFNRIQFLRDGVRNASSNFQSTLTSNIRSTGGDWRINPVPTNAYGQPLNCQVSACPGSSPAPSFQTANSPAATLAPQAVGPGLLRVAGRMVDYRRAYVLEDSRGQVLMYVTPQAGVDLEGYVNRVVSLYGPMSYRGDLRANYMTATRVTPLP